MDRGTLDFHQEVDCALDITGARATDLDIRGIPVDKIRRDPRTQKRIDPEGLEGIDFRALGFVSALPAYFERASRSGRPAVVVAPLGNTLQLPRDLRNFELA